MTPALVILAVIVAAGAVVAVGAATPRFAALGMFVALVGSAYVADPLPGPIGLAARLAGTTLASYLVWISLRRAPSVAQGSAVAWPGAAAIAAVAFVAGWLVADALGGALGAGAGDGPGPGIAGAALATGSLVARAARGASFALAAVAAGPVLVARDTLRMGIGLLLLLAAATLVRNALAGTGDDAIELGIAVLTALSGAAVAAVIAADLRRTGDLALRETLRRDPSIRHRAPDDAHRVTDGPRP
jgi:hypothetical protein